MYITARAEKPLKSRFHHTRHISGRVIKGETGTCTKVAPAVEGNSWRTDGWDWIPFSVADSQV